MTRKAPQNAIDTDASNAPAPQGALDAIPDAPTDAAATPEDFSLLAKLAADPRTKAAYQRQERYLEEYARTNSQTVALDAAGISARVLRHWRQLDYLDFVERERAAHRRYTDRLEAKLGELALAIKPGQNATPLLAALNAELPDKYRPQSQPPDENALRIVEELRALAKRKPDTKEPTPEGFDAAAWERKLGSQG